MGKNKGDTVNGKIFSQIILEQEPGWKIAEPQKYLHLRKSLVLKNRVESSC